MNCEFSVNLLATTLPAVPPVGLLEHSNRGTTLGLVSDDDKVVVCTLYNQNSILSENGGMHCKARQREENSPRASIGV